MSTKLIHCPSHTRQAFDPYTMPDIVRWAEEQVRKFRADAIVACGHSGLPIAGAVSYVTRIPIIGVRKEGEPTVAYNSPRVSAVLPNGKAQRWVWLDDFISGGGTFRNAAKEVWEAKLVEKPYPAAILEYRGATDRIYFAHNPPNYHEDNYRLSLGDVIPGYDFGETEIPSAGMLIGDDV